MKQPNFIIAPYLAKQFKILQTQIEKKDDKNIISLNYVNDLSEKDKNDIEYLIDRPISLHTKIDVDTFNKEYEKLYNNDNPIASVKEEQPKPEIPIVSNNSEEIKLKLKKLREEEQIKNKTITVSTYADDTSPKIPKPDDPPAVLQMDEFIKTLPTKALITEIRRRQLAEKMSGQIIVNNGQVKFQLNELTWPNGVYEISVHCSNDITEQYLESQKKQDAKNEEIKKD